MKADQQILVYLAQLRKVLGSVCYELADQLGAHFSGSDAELGLSGGARAGVAELDPLLAGAHFDDAFDENA